MRDTTAYIAATVPGIERSAALSIAASYAAASMSGIERSAALSAAAAYAAATVPGIECATALPVPDEPGNMRSGYHSTALPDP